MSTVTVAPVAVWNSGASFASTAAYWSLSAARWSVTPANDALVGLAAAVAAGVPVAAGAVAAGDGVAAALHAVTTRASAASPPRDRQVRFMFDPPRARRQNVLLLSRAMARFSSPSRRAASASSRRRPSIHDVAERAGVSVSTVSH